MREESARCSRDGIEPKISKRNTYDKWQGAHGPGQPGGSGLPRARRVAAADARSGLEPLARPEVLRRVRGPRKPTHTRETAFQSCKAGWRCASQQGYALYYVIKLGLEDARVDSLVERLLHWRWPDGGWNGDKEPSAAKSDLHPHHSQPARPASYGTRFRKPKALAAARQAALGSDWVLAAPASRFE